MGLGRRVSTGLAPADAIGLLGLHGAKSREGFLEIATIANGLTVPERLEKHHGPKREHISCKQRIELFHRGE
jgi:hypothetical protein